MELWNLIEIHGEHLLIISLVPTEPYGKAQKGIQKAHIHESTQYLPVKSLHEVKIN